MITEPDHYSDFDEPFEGSPLAKECRFCAILEGVDGERVLIATSSDASAFMSMKDGHPLVAPLIHVTGDETDHESRIAIAGAREWADILTPYVHKVYAELYGATGFSEVVNSGSRQSVKHYHINIEAWRGPKGSDEQILITDPQERLKFTMAIRREMDPEGLTNVPMPTHW